MSHLIVVTFDDEFKAEQVRLDLLNRESDDLPVERLGVRMVPVPPVAKSKPMPVRSSEL